MIKNRVRTLSPLEAQVVLSSVEDQRLALTRADVQRRLKGHAASTDQVIHSLRRKGWLERTGWGRYLIVPPERGPEPIGESNVLALAAHLTDPYYIGYGTAAAHYGFTTQSRRAVWLATTRAVRSRELRGVLVRIARLPAHKFFGYGPVPVFGVSVQMSDQEKTIVDCIDAMERAGGVGEVMRILAGAAPRLDWERVAAYALRMRSIALVQRLGFFADELCIAIPDDARAEMRTMLKGDSRSVLGPRPRPGDRLRYNAPWQLFVNVPEHELRAEVSQIAAGPKSPLLQRQRRRPGRSR